MTSKIIVRIDNEILSTLRKRHGRGLAGKLRDAIEGLSIHSGPFPDPRERGWWSFCADGKIVEKIEAYAKHNHISREEAVRQVLKSLL